MRLQFFKVLPFCVLASLCATLGFDPACRPQRQAEPSKKPSPEVFPLDSETRVSFTVELLAWDSDEEGLEYAYKNPNTQFNQSLSSLEPKSKFEPAFRIGVAGLLPYDRWTLGALYTFYRTTKDSSSHFGFDLMGAPGPGMIAVWTYPSAFTDNNTSARFENVSSLWKLHSSFLDLSLGREWAAGSRFSIAPSFGLRAAWLHQRYQVDYSSGNLIVFGAGNQISVLSSGINMNCSSNNVGPLFGCDMKWFIGTNWNLFTDISGSFLASRFHVGRRETDLFIDSVGALQTEVIVLKSDYWTFRPEGQIALGIQCSDSFRAGSRLARYFFSVAYEAEMWWKQNQFLRYIDQLNTSSSGAYVAPAQGDLLLHGVNVRAGLDY